MMHRCIEKWGDDLMRIDLFDCHYVVTRTYIYIYILGILFVDDV